MFNEVKKDLIPFVILEAHPDYKRPYVLPIFGMIEEDKLKDTILEKLVDFVYDRIDIDNLKNVTDVEKFWEDFYSDSYMDNTPWKATAILNGVWEYVSPNNEELFNALIKERTKIQNRVYMSSDSESDVETVESIILDNDSSEESEENEDSKELSMEKILEHMDDV